MTEQVVFSEDPFDYGPERKDIRRAVHDINSVRSGWLGTSRTMKLLGMTLAGAAATAAGFAEFWHVFFQHSGG